MDILQKYNRILFKIRTIEEAYIPTGRWFNYLVGIVNDIYTELQTIKTDISSVKRYKALLTQTGENPPVAIILENTLGEIPIYGYEGVGIYTITTTNKFTTNKTFVKIHSFTDEQAIGSQLFTLTDSVITFIIKDAESSVVDNILNYGSWIEIEVYP